MAEPKDVDQLLDQMLKGKTPEEILGKDGILKGLTKRLVVSSDTQSCAIRRHPVLRTFPPVNCAADCDLRSDLLFRATPSFPHPLSWRAA